MTEPNIIANRISRSYQYRRALRDFSLKADPGEVIGLLGPNGAGKTTALKILAGMIAPSGGSCRVGPIDSQNPGTSDFADVGVMIDGYEPVDWAVVQTLCDLQKAAAPKFNLNASREWIRSRGISLSSAYGALSKGQKRWVQAGLALFRPTRVLLMDEPAEGLDPEARRELYDLIRETANRSRATVLVSSHIIQDMERVLDRVIILRNGSIRFDDEIENIRETVREVETVASVHETWRDADMTPLAKRTEEDTMITVVRVDADGDRRLREKLSPTFRVNHMDLESLYLALVSKNDILVNLADRREKDGSDVAVTASASKEQSQ